MGQWRFKEESNRLGIWFRAAIYLILVSPVHPSNMHSGRENVQERLDRALCNQQWMTTFHDCRITHLPRTRSDHNLLLLSDGSPRRQLRRDTHFRVQAAWFLHPNFENILRECWMNDYRQPLKNKLQFLQQTLSQWNKCMFGNIFECTFRCMARGSRVSRKHSNSE